VEPVRHDQRVRDVVQPHSISVFARASRGRSTLLYSVGVAMLQVSEKSFKLVKYDKYAQHKRVYKYTNFINYIYRYISA